jgi:predicted MFS family arabinose efflux permease
MALPRRANGIRALASQMASKKLTEVAARQTVSDRLGYGVAAVIGAAAFHYGGPRWLGLVLAVYVCSAVLAYRRYKRLSA